MIFQNSSNDRLWDTSQNAFRINGDQTQKLISVDKDFLNYDNHCVALVCIILMDKWIDPMDYGSFLHKSLKKKKNIRE